MKTESKTFTWYATHPRDGELVLAVNSINSYKEGFIYAPRIIFERLRHKMNPLISLELSLGPMGAIPRKYYLEAGIIVETPLKVRFVALTEHSANPPTYESLEKHDGFISAFMLEAWQKNVIDPKINFVYIFR